MNHRWDKRLISREQAADLAGSHQVFWDKKLVHSDGRLVLRCMECEQSCGLWPPGVVTTPDDILAGVLRHLVTAHDLPLNNPAREKLESEADGGGDGERGTGDGGQADDPGGAGAGPAAGPGRGDGGPGGGGPGDQA